MIKNNITTFITNKITKTTTKHLLTKLGIITICLGSLGLAASLHYITKAMTANDFTAGSVVSIKLVDGSDYKMVVTNQKDNNNNGSGNNNYTMLMGLDNACTIPDVACVNRDGLPSSTGTVYNASSLTYSNSLADQEQSITTQTTNFYNLLPETFKHEAAVRSTAWTMPSIARSTNDTTTNGHCSIHDSNCTYTSPVFLTSYEEWQGELSGYILEPANGSVGDLWCKARYNTDTCKSTELYKHQNFPWLRTADANTTERTWSLRGMTGYSLNLDLAFNENGLLPAMYVNPKNFIIENGTGSYDDPYTLTSLAAIDPTHPSNDPNAPNTGVMGSNNNNNRNNNNNSNNSNNSNDNNSLTDNITNTIKPLMLASIAVILIGIFMLGLAKTKGKVAMTNNR